MKLSKKIAQRIVEKMMEVIPYNINIMDKYGIIIGSGDLNRVGDVHKGAKEALDKKSLNLVYNEDNGVKPGVNKAIIIDNEVIGVIGITGYSDEVKKFIKLAHVTAVLLIEQCKINEEIQSRKLETQRFYNELAYRKTPYDAKFYQQAQSLELNLSKNFHVILVYGDIISKKMKLLCKKFVHNCNLGNNKFAFFISEDYKNNFIIEDLKNCLDLNKVSIGENEHIIAISLEEAEKAMEIGIKIKPHSKVYEYSELKFFIHLSSNDKESCVSLFTNLDKLENKLEFIETIKVYIEENGEINNISSKLNIHRNTLNYRLDRIKKLTGKDPKNSFQLFELLCGLLWR